VNRVVVTGLGVICALGDSVGAVGDALRAGAGAIAPLSASNPDRTSAWVGAEIQRFDPLSHFESGQLGLLDRATQFALYAARGAVADAGFDRLTGMGPRCAAIIGSGMGNAQAIENGYRDLYVEKKRRTHPLTVPRVMMNAAVSHITMEHGITGPSFMVASACASANQAITSAYHMVRSGTVDVAVTGGTEACLTTGVLMSWEALRVMAPDTCRPFSRDRVGMVLGEGAAVFVLESLDHAKARGAVIHAEIVGAGMSSDAGNIVLPTLEGPVSALRACLADARLNPEQVGYINAHGTGTTANDVTETRAIRVALGETAERLFVSSTKSMHGHLLGGAGAVELLVTVLALRDGFIPPTVNFTESDPECDLDYVPNQARDEQVEVALSNSFAFGGHNSVIAARRFGH
jgi:nodulation protein E